MNLVLFQMLKPFVDSPAVKRLNAMVPNIFHNVGVCEWYILLARQTAVRRPGGHLHVIILTTKK